MKHPFKNRFAPKALAITACLIAVAIPVSYQLFKSSPEGGKTTTPSAAATRHEQTPQDNSVKSITEWQELVKNTGASGLRSRIEEAMKISDASLRNEVLASITERWLREDIAGFNKYWFALEVEGADDKLAMVAIALQVALGNLTPELSASDEIYVAVQRLISHLAGTDPAKALEWAKKWLLDDAQENALVSVARGMAKTNIEGALAIIDGIKSPLRKGQAIAAVGGIWASRDLNAASAWAKGLKSHADRAMALNSIHLTTADQNPAMAAAELGSQAREMNEQYLREREADLASRGVTPETEANDPDTYNEMLEAGTIPAPYSPDVELIGEAVKVVGKKLGESNSGDALEWSNSLETDYLKAKAIAGTIDGWAKTDPRAAFDYLNKNHPADTELLSKLYSSWAANDAKAAAESTADIADPAFRSIALESVIKTWAAKGNPEEVTNYLNSIPTADNTDAVKLAAATAVSQADPRKAWDIAKSISGEKVQIRALNAAFANLVIQNPGEAGALLESAALSENASSRLREMLDAVSPD
ncbi:MAG: hypothetical protein EOP88_13705 [Verrucomicrobiaceae bacterium]|nr:MAG: hypothetical protein EOP88_13705 [Verrucomicrobiaceae bacterium]